MLFRVKRRLVVACVGGMLSLGSLASAAEDYDYREHWTLSPTNEFAWRGDDHGSSYLKDVMSHTNDRFSAQYGPTTMAHETNHGLLAQMRLKTSDHDNFVYVEQGQGLYVAEPKTKFGQVAAYLPAGARRLASHRYQTYLIDQARSWSELLYCFDEWNSYVVNARVGVEIHQAGRWDSGGQDTVDGAMDFLYFGSAALLAVKKTDPEYFASNAQFKAAFAYLAEESARWITEGVAIEEFSMFHARDLYEHFVSSPENEAVRTLLKDWYGETWTQRVFGF